MARRVEYEKKIRKGKVAVVFSNAHGLGWSTYSVLARGKTRHHCEALMFDSRIVDAVLNGTPITEEQMKAWGHDSNHWYAASPGERLAVKWLPVGTRFFIEDYDGAETVRTERDFTFTA